MPKRSSGLALAFAIILVAASVPAFGADWKDCSAAGKPYTCFLTASGYKFETADAVTGGVLCYNPYTKTNMMVTSFPYPIPGGYDGTSDAKLWCFQVTPPPKGSTNSSISQINLQVGVPYFDPVPLITMDSSGQVFGFNLANGCLGDSTTGFEVGDLEACGVKWTYRVNPGSTPQRFSFMTKVTPETHDLGKGPVILAAKVGSSVEPGFILGPDRSSAYSATGMPHSVCQIINGSPYFFKKDDIGCTEEVYICHASNTKCDNEGTQFVEGPPPDVYTEFDANKCYQLSAKTLKLIVKRKDGGYLTPVVGGNPVPETLREVGFIGGNNACREGIITGEGSCTSTITIGGRAFVTTYYTSPPCPR